MDAAEFAQWPWHPEKKNSKSQGATNAKGVDALKTLGICQSHTCLARCLSHFQWIVSRRQAPS